MVYHIFIAIGILFHSHLSVFFLFFDITAFLIIDYLPFNVQGASD